MPTITTSTFSYDTQDVVRAAMDYTRPQRTRRFWLTGLAIAVSLAVIACPIAIVQAVMPEHADWVWGDFLLTLQEHRSTLTLLAAVILLGILGKPLLWRYGIWKNLRDNRAQYCDLQVAFSDEGIDFTWPNAALHNDWTFYSSIIESKEFFLLVYGTLYVAVPKRAVPDVPALADLLRRHVPAYFKQGSRI